MKVVKAILAGTIYTPAKETRNEVILIEGHRIAKVGPRDQATIPPGATIIDKQDRTVVPGSIDIHIHGAVGYDLMEATPETVEEVGKYLARHGTNSYAATTVAASLERTLNPAGILGLKAQKGVIGPLADADLAVLDQKFYVTQTYVRGRPVLQA
jgi:N-acetylglucosamine-6-phosphate deacetylase